MSSSSCGRSWARRSEAQGHLGPPDLRLDQLVAGPDTGATRSPGLMVGPLDLWERSPDRDWVGQAVAVGRPLPQVKALKIRTPVPRPPRVEPGRQDPNLRA